ncbi:cilia- and flagella-associated protein 251 isoform X1 [Aedes aegypti]|uniref:Cilia- and flagella-associated protein 251 n=2 Tax=Aedes aegypti TaxID=7159 RepID=A0A6I8THG9_AEDAE|nr:cilia- and flagella-associated protein 251 isoform X1 [Aedes aegypti]
MGEIVPYTKNNESFEDLQHRCQPFKLEWIFGFNPRIPVVNLTCSRQVREMIMSSGNAIIFYRFENQVESTQTLIGHKDSINTIVVDGSGRFVVSSDSSYCINVWDREAFPDGPPVAIRTIYEPFKANEINTVGLSHDARYLIAACSGTEQLLKLWQWTIGNDSPDDCISLPPRLGRTKGIRFCTDIGRKNHFVVTMENAVIFGYFDPKQQKLHIEVPKKHGFQDYNDSVFVDDTSRAVSVTAAGMAIIWSDDKKVSTPIKKQFLKYLHLKYASINVIRCCDQKLVTGDDDGEIRFYDIHMRILYWFKQEGPEPIRTISFNILPRKYVLDNEQAHSSDDTDEEVLSYDTLPRDVSLEGNPVIIRNFIMATKTGHLFDVDIVQNKIQELYYSSGSIITSFDVHPIEPQLCSCDGNGKMTLYNLEDRQAIMSLNVPIQRTRRGRITVLKYSPCGTYLVGGAENGYIWVINPATMIISSDSPLQYTIEKIIFLNFTPDSKYIIFVDDEGSIGLLNREYECWKLIGRCLSHKVVDLLFMSNEKFLTIGDDRHLIQYKIETSDMASIEKLMVDDRFQMEQSAQSTSFLLLPEDRLLVANNQFKFKIFNLNSSCTIMHTFLAPFNDGPIRKLTLLPGDHFFTFMTDKNIYIHQLPIDGNPFKYLGTFSHPKKLKAMCNMRDHFVFCHGEGDHGIGMWRINAIPLIENQKYCGSGLDPYCSLLPGGKSGCYVKEMLSLFFYNQISPKHNEEDTDISIRDAMDVRDVPNYMRSIGFHMTQFEEDNLIKEIDQMGTLFLTFEEVVKLFLNHRTLANPDCEEIRAALTMVTKGVFDPIDLQSFNEQLADLGEKVNTKALDFYCRALFPEYTPDADEDKFLVPLDAFAEKLC